MLTRKACFNTRSRSVRVRLDIRARIFKAYPRSSLLLKLDSRGLQMPSCLRCSGSMSSKFIDAGIAGFLRMKRAVGDPLAVVGGVLASAVQTALQAPKERIGEAQEQVSVRQLKGSAGHTPVRVWDGYLAQVVLRRRPLVTGSASSSVLCSRAGITARS